MSGGGGRPVGSKNSCTATTRKQTSSQKKRQAERSAATKQKFKKEKEQQNAAVKRAVRMKFFAPRTKQSSGEATAAPINDKTTTAATDAINTSMTELMLLLTRIQPQLRSQLPTTFRHSWLGRSYYQ